MVPIGLLEDINVGSNLSDVEILDTMSGQWYHCPSLPHPCSSVSVAIIDITMMCFALGGFTANHKGSKKRSKNSEVSRSVCLDALVPQATVLPPVYSEKVLHSSCASLMSFMWFWFPLLFLCHAIRMLP